MYRDVDQKICKSKIYINKYYNIDNNICCLERILLCVKYIHISKLITGTNGRNENALIN